VCSSVISNKVYSVLTPFPCSTDEEPRLNLLSLAPSSTPYRSVKTRGPSIKCIACGPNATVTDDLGAVPYEAFCGLTGVPEEEESRGGRQIPRIRVKALREALTSNTSTKNILIDTRQETEYGICSLPKSSSKCTFTSVTISAYS
jgi:adenylyltransferase/sulfurtransferase